MIEVYQHAEEATRTPENASYWLAECTIDGQSYSARSRRGAPHELARLLVDAGIPDQPMIVRSFGLAGHAAYRSIHAAAKRTIVENASHGPISARWNDPALVDFAALRAHRETNAASPIAGAGEPVLMGVRGPDGPLVPGAMSHSKCKVCGKPIEPAFRGPQHRFCGSACRKRASRARAAP